MNNEAANAPIIFEEFVMVMIIPIFDIVCQNTLDRVFRWIEDDGQ